MMMTTPGQPVLVSERLALYRFTDDDADFTLELLNDPSFLEHIGDKGVRTQEDAQRYIAGLRDSYERLGLGLYRVDLRRDGTSVGMCGLVDRPTLTDVDLGFAFLPRHWSRGYAFESAEAVLTHARTALGRERVLAVVSPTNASSKRLLAKLGFAFEGLVRLSEDEDEIELHAWQHRS